MRMNLLEISRLLDAVYVGLRPEDALARPTGAASDSRKVKPGDLFFCLVGEQVDGHDFAEAAVQNGAFAIIATRDPFDGKNFITPVLIVRDVAAALAKVANAHRALAKSTVIGVTGSCGKTSVKEALAAVLSVSGETAKNPMNLNTQVGLPLSMLNASEDAAYWVMEAGISQPHDMDELGAILQPDIALIVNVGPAHTEELGDKGVPHYKARFLAYLPPDGQGVVSADYPALTREAEAYAVDMVRFSAENSEETYYAAYLGPDGATRGRFQLLLDGESVTVSAPFPGAYGAENVAAVGAVAYTVGMTASEIAEGFSLAQPPAQRFTIREEGAFLVVDDSYNANPLSMRRMLETAASMAADRGADLFLVLGEMRELGTESPEHHEALGREAAALSPRAVVWKGGMGDLVARGLTEAGYAGPFMQATDAASFREAARAVGMASGLVLFKGSRGTRVDEFVTAFADLTGQAR